VPAPKVLAIEIGRFPAFFALSAARLKEWMARDGRVNDFETAGV